VANDDGLHVVKPVDADNLGTCDDHKPTAAGTGSLQKAPPKTPRDAGVGRTQDDENALDALQRDNSGRARGAGIVGDDDIDGSAHCVRLAITGSVTATGPSLRPSRNRSGDRATPASGMVRLAVSCWVSLIVVSEYQRGVDRRGVIRRVASAPLSKIERSGQSS
jgi:hypothetical protein